MIASMYQISCIILAYIPGSEREPLRIDEVSKLWEPKRIPTPRFIDAWTTNENEGSVTGLLPVILDSTCENVAVWRAESITERERSELHVNQGEISFCKVFAQSGSGHQDEPQMEGDEDEDDEDM
jgi:hypothetical protein